MDVHNNALRMAKAISRAEWQLDDVYVVDIAISGPEVNGIDPAMIIEFNSFCSAGLYACDRDRIVKDVTLAALYNAGAIE